MEYIVLDINEATEEQFISTIESNNRTARLMRSEIAKLRRVAETAKKTKKPQRYFLCGMINKLTTVPPVLP